MGRRSARWGCTRSAKWPTRPRRRTRNSSRATRTGLRKWARSAQRHHAHQFPDGRGGAAARQRELVESRVPPPVDATVTVVFWISPDGKVSRIEEVRSQPERAGIKACLSAITRAETFGPWTEEMRRTLGVEEKMTFTFRYEDTPKKKPNKAPKPRPERATSHMDVN